MRTLSTVLSCLALSACGGLPLQAAAPVGEPLVAGVETSQEPRDGLFRVEESVEGASVPAATFAEVTEVTPAPSHRPAARRQGATGGAEEPKPWEQRFIDPVSAPLTFETPVHHTGFTGVFLHHRFPETSFFKGGHLTGGALQLRWAVTERFSIIAVKDGRFALKPGQGQDATGWADVGGGIKYAVIDDKEDGFLMSLGLTYEATNGDSKIFQGNGAGLWRPFVTAGVEGEDVNVLASVAASVPVSRDRESTSFDWHLQFTPADAEEFVPLLEINGIYYYRAGRALPVNFEGVDYANLGSSKVQGNNLITAAAGMRWRVAKHSDLGIAFERPVTNRKDIFRDRITVDWVRRF